MLRLLGEYDVAVDAKGRFLLPAAFRKQLPQGSGDRFVINRGFEKCLVMYTMESWEKASEEVNNLDDFTEKNRKMKRLFNNGATIVEPDSADRLLVQKKLLEHVGIDKEMVLAAQGNKVELWDKDTYYAFMNDNLDDYSQLAEEVLGKGSKKEAAKDE